MSPADSPFDPEILPVAERRHADLKAALRRRNRFLLALAVGLSLLVAAAILTGLGLPFLYKPRALPPPAAPREPAAPDWQAIRNEQLRLAEEREEEDLRKIREHIDAAASAREREAALAEARAAENQARQEAAAGNPHAALQVERGDFAATLDDILKLPDPENQAARLTEFYGGKALYLNGRTQLINLSGQPVGDEELAQFPWSRLGTLREINLRGTRVTGATVDRFLALPDRTALHRADFRGTKITEDSALDRFRKAFPNCDVYLNQP